MDPEPSQSLFPESASLPTRKDELLASLTIMPDPESRLEWLMEMAKERPRPDASIRVEANEVPGCISRVWMTSAFRDGRCWFLCDAESLVVLAVAGLLADFYNGATPQEILGCDPSFLKEAGITSHLSSNRRNALSKVWLFIRACAQRHLGDTAAS